MTTHDYNTGIKHNNYGFWKRIFSRQVDQCENVTVPMVSEKFSDCSKNEDTMKCSYTNQQDKNLEAYYNQIAQILESNGISVEEAKRIRLLEKLVLTEGINKENFEDIKEALEVALGDISFKHLGRSLFNAVKNIVNGGCDISTLMENVQEELWNDKTETPIWGRKHFDTNAKLAKKLESQDCLADGDNIEQGLNNLVQKCKDGEISQKEIVRILVDISNSKDINKASAVRLIKALSNDDRALAIALMQNIDNLSKEELSSIDLEFVKEIKDIALGMDNSVQVASSVTRKSFSEMLEDDMREGVKYLSQSTDAFLAQNYSTLARAKEKRNYGQALTPEEQMCLELNDIYAGMNAAGVTGASQNTNVSYDVVQEIITDVVENVRIASEKYNIDFDNDVFTNIAAFVADHPEYFKNMSVSEFTKLLNNVSNGKYGEIVAQYNKNKISYNIKKTDNTNDRTQDARQDKSIARTRALADNMQEKHKHEIPSVSEVDKFDIDGLTNLITIDSNPKTKVVKNDARDKVDVKDINECAKYGEQGVDLYFANNNSTEAISNAFKNNNQRFKAKAVRKFKTENANTQERILLSTGISGKELINDAKDKCLRDIKFANNSLNQKVSDVIESRTKYNPEREKYFEEVISDEKSCA